MPLRVAFEEKGAFALALIASLIVGAALAHSGPGLAALLVAVPIAAVLLVPRPQRVLPAGVILALTVPAWWSIGIPQASLRLAASLALTSLVVTQWRTRFTVADAMLLAYFADSVLSAVLQTAEPGIWRALFNIFLPVAFYVAARVVPVHLQRRVVATAVAAIAIGALTVIFERFVGHSLFRDPNSYNWAPSHGGIFRPGGIYGSPPAASLAMSVGLLLGLALRRRATAAQRLALSASGALTLIALVFTFERSGMIALAAGVIFYVLLIRRDARSLLKYSIALGLVTLVAIVAYPNVQSNSTFQNGILHARSGNTLGQRISIWKEELPVVTSNLHTAAFGVGFASTVLARNGGRVPAAIAFSPLLISYSIHSQYLLVLLEQGGIGLALFVLFLASAVWSGLRFADRERDRLAAALTASALAIVVISLTYTSLLDRSSSMITLLVLGLLVSRVQRAPDPR